MRTPLRSIVVGATLAVGGLAFGQSDVVGEWGPLLTSTAGTWRSSLYSIHAIHLPTGKIMMWGYPHQAPQCQLWDPVTGVFTQTDPKLVNPDGNPFCVGHSLLADGSVFMAGGHVVDYFGQRYAYKYDPFTGENGTWTALPLMKSFRWYPTCTTLPDGRVLVTSGTQYDQSEFNDTVYRYLWADYPEIYDPASNSWTTAPLPYKVHWYPFMFVAPSGKVVNAGRYLRIGWPDNAKSYQLDLSSLLWTAITPAQPIQGGSAVMYEPGKIMKCGGEDPTRTDGNATNRTAVLDLNQANPQWVETAPMAQKRRDQNLVLLPDGKVLAIGGSFVFDQPPTGLTQRLSEIWDPATMQWTAVATQSEARLYHSTAVLLNDGRVLCAGGNLSPTGQIYSPPYLFKGDRPIIDNISKTRFRANESLFVDVPGAGSNFKVVLMGLNAATHAFDQNQRRIPLSTFKIGGGRLLAMAPASNNIAPPGYYMLFVLNGSGVPSIAKYVRMLPPLKKMGGE